MKKCKFCMSEIDGKASICPACKRQQNDNVLIRFFISLLIFGCIGGYFYYTFFYKPNNDFADFSQYDLLDPQELHKDYLNNEVSAKNKYTDKFYYFSGTIYNIKQVLNDNYIEIRYPYEKNKNNIIELNAYFFDANDLINLNKGDEITVYCKFQHRSIENYLGITSYSFKSCKIK